MSEGLMAVYQFESKVSTADASQPGGRLAYAGVSGGFGTITLGQIWNAAYNHVGAITDGSWFYGNAHMDYRHGNALSYATSVGPVSMQLDAILDGKMNTDSAVDKVEFGMTVDLGDIGKVALAHTNMKDQVMSGMYHTMKAATAGDPDVETAVSEIMVLTNKANRGDDGVLNKASLAMIMKDAKGKYSSNLAMCDKDGKGTPKDATDDCVMATAYVSSKTTHTETAVATRSKATENEVGTKTVETYYDDEDVSTKTKVIKDGAGAKKNHIAVQLALGPVTGYLGHSTIKMNGASDKDKVTHYGLSGGLGDSGFSFHAMGRKVEDADGMETSPWLIGITKGLGGGATAMIEHGNDDDGSSGKTQVGLMVNF